MCIIIGRVDQNVSSATRKMTSKSVVPKLFHVKTTEPNLMISIVIYTVLSCVDINKANNRLKCTVLLNYSGQQCSAATQLKEKNLDWLIEATVAFINRFATEGKC